MTTLWERPPKNRGSIIDSEAKYISYQIFHTDSWAHRISYLLDNLGSLP
jgi:hypothetical protein